VKKEYDRLLPYNIPAAKHLCIAVVPRLMMMLATEQKPVAASMARTLRVLTHIQISP